MNKSQKTASLQVLLLWFMSNLACFLFYFSFIDFYSYRFLTLVNLVTICCDWFYNMLLWSFSGTLESLYYLGKKRPQSLRMNQNHRSSGVCSGLELNFAEKWDQLEDQHCIAQPWTRISRTYGTNTANQGRTLTLIVCIWKYEVGHLILSKHLEPFQFDRIIYFKVPWDD